MNKENVFKRIYNFVFRKMSQDDFEKLKHGFNEVAAHCRGEIKLKRSISNK